MNNKARVKMIAVCGIFSAAELVIIYLSSVFQMLDLVIALMTVAFTLVLLCEYGSKPAIAVYLAVSVLSMLIVPNKFTPLCYVFFIGIYPIIKPYFERLKKPFSIILKFVYFNVFYLAIYAICVKFALLDDIFAIGSAMFFVVIVLGNLAFFLCDYVFGLMTLLYVAKLRKRLGFERIFKK